jgi:hypothetical protein
MALNALGGETMKNICKGERMGVFAEDICCSKEDALPLQR